MINKLHHLVKFAILSILFFCQLSFSSTNDNKFLNEKLLKVSDHEKIKTLNDLAVKLLFLDPSKATNHCRQALKLAELLTNNFQIAVSHSILGSISFDSGKYAEALKHQFKARDIRVKLADKNKLGNSLNNIAIIYDELGNYTNALNYYLEALLIYEKNKDIKGRASCLANLGGFYNKLSLPYKALDYLTNSLSLFKKTDDKEGVAVALGNISTVFNSINKYQKALDYQFDSLKIEKELNNKLGIAISLSLIAEVYEKMTNFNKSIDYYNKALIISKSINNKILLCENLTGIGSTYSELGNQNKALEFQQLALSNSLIFGTTETTSACFEQLAKTFCRMGNYDNAIEMFKSHSKLKENLFSQSLIKKMALSTDKYTVEKNKQKKQLLVSKNKIQKLKLQNLKVYILTAFLIIIILSVTIFFMKKNIKKRKLIENELRERENLYRTIFECSPLGIARFNKDTEIISVNDKYLEILGTTKDKIVGFNMLESLDNEKVRQTLLDALDGKISVYEGEYLSVTGYKKSFVRVTYNRIIDNLNKLLGGICIVEDITVRNNAENEKKKLELQLARSHKMETIGLLAGGVAHDLNNVLCAVVSYPELILMNLPKNSPVEKLINKIKQAGEEAAAIVQDMLTLARRGVNTVKVLNINDIIISSMFSPECEKLKDLHSNIKIKTKLQNEISNIEGSEVHLKKTIINLLINAAEAQPDGGKIIVSTETKYIDKPIKGYETICEGNYVIIKVIDNGIGISDDDLERIFEPFYTKKIMGRSGTGLGMSVVWGTVQDHNGYIDVISSKGYGTTFELYFPVSEQLVSEEKKRPSLNEYLGNRETVLVIDDLYNQRVIAKNILEKLGYSVNTVASGEDAIDYIKKNPQDIIVLDMIMEPGIDGLETYREILKFYPNQKAIIASGFSENERVKETQEIGAGIYIKKPYTIENIGLAIKNELK